MTANELPMNIEDELSDLTADLLSDTRYEPALVQLFSQKAGIWVLVASVVDNEPRLKAVEEAAGGPLHMAWMDYSGSDYGDGYCTIAFFVEASLWSSIAIYNRGRLLRDYKVRSKKATSVHS